ncbi:MAG TPA: zinc ribbon domain-containing protein [Candidatus Margulisiibacteriota bacterium]|nr:zinc ribbon domain-containing protein [Candidatus Margulisiibacteriota bacterium]
MSLIPCPECTKVVSNQAFFCPHCGYPLHPQIKNVVLKGLRILTEIVRNVFTFLVTLVLLILAIGLLMYVSIRAFDYVYRLFIK